MPNCCFSQECLRQWKHKEAFLQWLPFLHLHLKWMSAVVIEQRLSVLSDGLSVVGKDSPPSQVDSGWWARALCPLRYIFSGGQWFSELSEGFSTVGNGSPPSQVNSPTGFSQFSILLLIKITIRFFYISDVSRNSTDPLTTYPLSQTCTLN